MSIRQALVVSLGLFVLVSCGLAAVPTEANAAQDGVSVIVTPASQETDVGSTTTYDLVVDDVSGGGVGAVDVTLRVDGSVATVSNASFVPDPGLSEVTYGDGRSRVRLYAALIDTSQSGSVTIATVTVEGTANGTSPIAVNVTDIGSEGGVSYRIDAVENGSLAVGEAGSNTTERASEDGSSQDDDSGSPSEETSGELTVSAMGENGTDGVTASSPSSPSSSAENATDGQTGTAGTATAAASETATQSSPSQTETSVPGLSVLLTVCSLLAVVAYFVVASR
ncbi:hypothetical protein [Haloferax sp. Q22]|uniref:hypothetical protein n=1 Tax=Haloferax sp. (strain Q22) TaxID=1526048 RepID=UPI000737D06F|nr:hypothetical protein [Haloferax sp. Q22]